MQITLDERWSIFGKPHGGYLLRELVRPTLTEQHPDPLAVSAHFLRSPAAGAATVEVEKLRSGRSVTASRARLAQDVTLVEVLVSSGRLSTGDPVWRSAAGPPDLPPVEECTKSLADQPFGRVGHLEFVDLRLDLSVTDGFAGWIRLAGTEASALDLVLLADALPPVTIAMGMPGWAPTVELTVHVRAVPAPGWLRITQRAQLLAGGLLDEECEIWDSADRLVCQARQLAAFRAAPSG